MYSYTHFYYYFEQVNVAWKVIKVVLNLDDYFEVWIGCRKQRKMSASNFLTNEAADFDLFEVTPRFWVTSNDFS